MQDRIVVLILLLGTCVGLYYCFSANLFTTFEMTLSKIFLLAVPYIMYVLLLFMPKVKPDDVTTFAKSIRFRILMVFVLNIAVIIGLSRGAYENQHQILAIFVSLFICLFGNHVARIKKSNEMMGFKTPWTGNDIEHLYKTNQFGGKLLNFVGIVGMISASYISPIFSTLLVLCALISIYVFSYFLSKKAG